MSRPPVALTIAGSDPSGGAGIQADLKTFSALGVYGTCVITALTAQNTRGVSGVHVIPADFVTQQLETLVADVRLDAIKIGMLANAGIVGAVHDFLGRHPHDHVVLDPVMVATSGDRLLDDDAVRAIRNLMPLVSLITPNLAEAAALLDTGLAATVADMRVQAVALREMGAQRVLIKGGHLDERADAVDLLLHLDGEQVLRAPRVSTVNTHGTGCTLSSALAALRPQRDSWLQAALDAKSWLTAALEAADSLEIGHDPEPEPGRGPAQNPVRSHGPVHHFHAIWDR
ncbi:MAG: bifunctional hydroxymethylpyrimidine kinase/phosphomethylpyrimidine kinase [Actinomycetota bacterium]